MPLALCSCLQPREAGPASLWAVGSSAPRLPRPPTGGRPVQGDAFGLVFLFSSRRVDGPGVGWGLVCDTCSGLTFCPRTPLLMRGTCVWGKQQLVSWFPTLFRGRRGGYPTMAGSPRPFQGNPWLWWRQYRIPRGIRRDTGTRGSEHRPDSCVSGWTLATAAALPVSGAEPVTEQKGSLRSNPGPEFVPEYSQWVQAFEEFRRGGCHGRAGQARA